MDLSTLVDLSHGYVKLTEFINNLFKWRRITLRELLLELSLELLLELSFELLLELSLELLFYLICPFVYDKQLRGTRPLLKTRTFEEAQPETAAGRSFERPRRNPVRWVCWWGMLKLHHWRRGWQVMPHAGVWWEQLRRGSGEYFPKGDDTCWFPECWKRGRLSGCPLRVELWPSRPLDLLIYASRDRGGHGRFGGRSQVHPLVRELKGWPFSRRFPAIWNTWCAPSGNILGGWEWRLEKARGGSHLGADTHFSRIYIIVLLVHLIIFLNNLCNCNFLLIFHIHLEYFNHRNFYHYCKTCTSIQIKNTIYFYNKSMSFSSSPTKVKIRYT